MNLLSLQSFINLVTSQVAGLRIKTCKANKAGYKTIKDICQFCIYLRSIAVNSMPQYVTHSWRVNGRIHGKPVYRAFTESRYIVKAGINTGGNQRNTGGNYIIDKYGFFGTLPVLTPVLATEYRHG